MFRLSLALLIISISLGSFTDRGKTTVASALSEARADHTSLGAVADAIAAELNSNSELQANKYLVADQLCLSLRGLTCRAISAVEPGNIPAKFYESADHKFLCVVAGIVSGGHLESVAFAYRREHAAYISDSPHTLLSRVLPQSIQLPAPSVGAIRILVWGAEESANRAITSVAIVDLFPEKIAVLLERHSLLEGEVSYKDGLLQITSTKLERDKNDKLTYLRATTRLRIEGNTVRELDKEVIEPQP